MLSLGGQHKKILYLQINGRELSSEPSKNKFGEDTVSLFFRGTLGWGGVKSTCMTTQFKNKVNVLFVGWEESKWPKLSTKLVPWATGFTGVRLALQLDRFRILICVASTH